MVFTPAAKDHALGSSPHLWGFWCALDGESMEYVCERERGAVIYPLDAISTRTPHRQDKGWKLFLFPLSQHEQSVVQGWLMERKRLLPWITLHQASHGHGH